MKWLQLLSFCLVVFKTWNDCSFYHSCWYCFHQGECKRQIHDTVQRLWDIIENITVDKLGMINLQFFVKLWVLQCDVRIVSFAMWRSNCKSCYVTFGTSSFFMLLFLCKFLFHGNYCDTDNTVWLWTCVIAVMFMRANIVGTVITLSLVVWIPLSCTVACIVSNHSIHILKCWHFLH